MQTKTILIIGDVFVDTHLDIVLENGPLVRLGGVFHSVRAFSAFDEKFLIGYVSPSYLDKDIENYSIKFNSLYSKKIGDINSSPNLVLINDSKEIGNQGYCNILKDQVSVKHNSNLKQIISDSKPSDILIYPNSKNLQTIMSDLDDYVGRIHIDIQHDGFDLRNMDFKAIDTLIISTSSDCFKSECNGSKIAFFQYFKEKSIKRYLIKENRGGSSCYDNDYKLIAKSDFYYVNTMHSVGVGDVYNAVFVSSIFDDDIRKKMSIASHIAAGYASTFDYEIFKEKTKIIIENKNDFCLLKGYSIEWEKRKSINIYLAGPDFPDVDTTYINLINNALLNHNFQPRLPIRENGLYLKSMSKDRELTMYYNDRKLMEECDMIVGVLIFNDPGTLVEVGMFCQMNKPSIIFDPNSVCDNMFVLNSVNCYCKTIEEVINAVFKIFGENHEKK